MEKFHLTFKEMNIFKKTKDKKREIISPSLEIELASSIFNESQSREQVFNESQSREQVKDKIMLFITTTNMTINDAQIIFKELLEWANELPNKIKVEEITDNHSYQTEEYQKKLSDTNLKVIEVMLALHNKEGK